MCNIILLCNDTHIFYQNCIFLKKKLAKKDEAVMNIKKCIVFSYR